MRAASEATDDRAVGDELALTPVRLRGVGIAVHPVGETCWAESAVEAWFRRGTHASVDALVDSRRGPGCRTRDWEQRNDQRHHAQADEDDAKMRPKRRLERF